MLVDGITAMPKPAACLSFGHGRQDGGEGAVEGAAGACWRSAPSRVDLRPTRLDGRQIRHGGRPRAPPDTMPGPHGRKAPRLMPAPVGQPDEGPWTPRRPQPMRNLRATHRRVHGPGHRQHGWPPVGTPAAPPRHLRPLVLRHGADDPLPLRGTSVPAGQGQIDAGGVAQLPPAAVARGGLQRWLLRGSSRRPTISRAAASPRG
jgi:hypothetical protein